ncbi:MAG TPA: SulP family inorganic anion transporter, partial [Gammaproteobacteria bacterium]|nr:SulP family inorganic anion transporter [Gammaproteobacteria bacterium]
AGLYTALAAMLVYPLLGSCRVLIVSSSSALAMMTASAVAATAPTEGVEPLAVAATLALMVGAVLMAASLLRLGFLANYISLPVLIGFQAGVGIVIVVGQARSLLGVDIESETTIGKLFELPSAVPQAHGLTVLVAAIAIGALVVLARLWPRRPIPFLIVVLGIAASWLFGFEARGVATVGALPPGLPPLRLPDVSLLTALWPASLGIAVMAFVESITAARTNWQQDEPPVRANRELLALGAANAAVAFAGGMPADGTTSQTAVARRSGARSPAALWAVAAAVVATLLLLSRAIAVLPKPALAAVLVVVAAGLVKPGRFLQIARVRRMELVWALVTVVGVVALGPLAGILLAVALSVLTLIYQANRPPVYALAYNREQRVFRKAGEHEGDETLPGLLLLRVEGRLTFASAENAADKIRPLVEQSNARVVVLECSAILDIEYTALTALAAAEQRLRERGAALWLAGVNPGLLPVLQRSALAAASDPSRVFADLHQAVEAWERRAPGSETLEKAEVRS